MALWHKKGQSSFVRCGPGWQSLKQSPGRVHNRESEQSLGRGKTQVTRCGMGEGGQAPRCGQAMHQSWVHILFILFPGGVFRHFLLQPSWGFFFTTYGLNTAPLSLLITLMLPHSDKPSSWHLFLMKHTYLAMVHAIRTPRVRIYEARQSCSHDYVSWRSPICQLDLRIHLLPHHSFKKTQSDGAMRMGHHL